ncbi:MAG: hypothetical protein HZB68_01430 [Candidatus Aenigmarchaeota archaeon]|nr:hypothetical protein [Candidatus Aenigmarchaeota archaeon]
MAFKTEPQIDLVANELIRANNDNIQRIRVVEEKLRLVENRLESQEGSLVRIETAVKKGFDEMKDQLKKLNISVAKLENDDTKLREGFDKAPRRAELEELKSFINMLSPLSSQYVTRKEIEEIMSSVKEKKKSS